MPKRSIFSDKFGRMKILYESGSGPAQIAAEVEVPKVTVAAYVHAWKHGFAAMSAYGDCGVSILGI